MRQYLVRGLIHAPRGRVCYKRQGQIGSNDCIYSSITPPLFTHHFQLFAHSDPLHKSVKCGEGRTEEVPFLFNAARITQPPTCMKPVACVRMHTRSRCGGDAVAGSAPDPVSVSAAESLTQSLSSMKVATRPTTTVTA